jgi:hypothetical protein
MVPIIDRLNNRRTFFKSFESGRIGPSACRILKRRWRLSYIFLLVVIFNFLCASPSAGEADRGVKPAEEAVSSLDFGTYHALIIGINEYSEWPPLKFAERDASDVRQILINRYGFAPERVTDLFGAKATRKNILSELRNKLESLGENDNLLIYYAGHGNPDLLTENGFWIPVEGALYDEAGWIAFSNINALLTGRKVEAKSIMVLTDSCYGGAILARSGPPPDYMWETDENIKQNLIRKAKKRCRRVIASGAYEHVPDRSLFADLLKQALEENPYPMIDLEYLFYTKVYQQLRDVGQEPVSGPLRWGSEEDGKFVLLQKEKVAGLGPTPAPPKPAPQTESKVVLTVRSNVHGDTVYIDGEAKGSTRLDLELAPRDYMVRVEKEGYKPYEEQVELSPGQSITLWAKLEPKVIAAPVIDYFDAGSLRIRKGQSSTLRWRTQNAENVEIIGIGGVPLSGSRQIEPSQTTNYVLIATNKEGREIKKEIRITVEIEPPRIVSFRASPTSILRGESSTLRWQTENAQSVQITRIGRVELSGSMRVNPSETASYKLIAKNEQGVRIEKSRTVAVRAQPPRILSFRADRPTIKRGESSRLRWKVSEAIKVSMDGRTVRASDSMTVNPRQDSKYVLTAKNEDGVIVTKDLLIRVIIPDPEIVSFEAVSPIDKGSASTLTWKTRNSKKVEIIGVGTVGSSGTQRVEPSETTTYTLIVTNESGLPVEQTATVKVVPKPTLQPPTRLRIK